MNNTSKIVFLFIQFFVLSGCTFSARNYEGYLEPSKFAVLKAFYKMSNYLPYSNFENVIFTEVLSADVRECEDVVAPLQAKPCAKEVKIDGRRYDVLKLLPGRYRILLRCEFQGSYAYPIFDYEYEAGYTYIVQCERFEMDGKMMVKGSINSKSVTE